MRDLIDFNRWMEGEIDYDQLTGESKIEADEYLRIYWADMEDLCKHSDA